MREFALLIKETNIEYTREVLLKHRIHFIEADVVESDKVDLYQSFESSMNKKEEKTLKEVLISDAKKINNKPIPIVKNIKPVKKEPEKTIKSKSQKKHNDMLRYASKLGFDSIGSAIQEIGSGAKFNMEFKKEYLEYK